jgi:acyl-CoA thioester hydrolase
MAIMLATCADAARLANPLLVRASYPHFERIQTRWNDNDSQGHINNAQYYDFIDNAVNNHIVSSIGIERSGEFLRFTSESSCRYLRQLSYPTPLDVGLRLK